MVNYQVLLTVFELYGNSIVIIAVNANAVACSVFGISCADFVICVNSYVITCAVGGILGVDGVNILTICTLSLDYRSNVGACCNLGLGCLQLGHVNCVCEITACCHVGDLAGIIVGNSLLICIMMTNGHIT